MPNLVKELTDHCLSFKGAETKRSLIQLTSTFALFILTCALMFYTASASYILTLFLAFPAAGLLTRMFIFQHDCGHRAFFKSKKANDWTGRLISLLTFTPYDFWRRAHNKHHCLSGDLDRRSIGGIDTITVKEYLALSKPKRLAYKLYRNPLLLIFIGTPLYVILAQRIPYNPETSFYENYQSLSSLSIWKSIMLTNISLVAFYSVISLMLGPVFFAVYLPILVITCWIGGWLFYVQHQFEDTYWERNEDWNMQEAALMGSSYYDLPKILQWFVGNIGFHHIHHLCCNIPNYKLQECMDTKPELKKINRITFLESLKCARLKLWDEDQKKLVPFP